MKKAQQKRFDSLYQQHLNALLRQGKSKATSDSYSRAVRRITAFFDCSPEKLSVADLKDYFTSLVKSHSWSTVKLDRNGLQFFYKHVLGKQWQWVDIIKPPQVRSLPKATLLALRQYWLTHRHKSFIFPGLLSKIRVTSSTLS